MRLGEPAKMQAAINITPLVDVVLVLLIIFMVMAPTMRKGPDAVEELLAGALGAERARFETRLSFLATLASNAPYVGLFGTVVGIINAFRSIAATGSGGMSVVSGGIAEALVSTALGIFVAIPAVVAFNHFTGKIENFHVQMNRASSQLVNCLFKIPETKVLEVEVEQEVKVPVTKGGHAYAAR